MTTEKPPQPGDLRKEATLLREVVGELVTKVDVAQQQTKLLRWLTWGIAGLAIIAIILGVLLFQQNQRTNAFLEEGRRSRQSIALVRDCVDPKGVCYRRQQASTAKVIGQITDANHNGRPDTQEILDAIKALQAQRR